MKRLWTTRREHARMMLRITLVRAAGALAACLLLSGLPVSAQAAAAQSQPAGLSNVEKRDLLYMERDGQLTAEQLKALEVLRAAGKMPAPLPPVYAIRGDELQALLLREQRATDYRPRSKPMSKSCDAVARCHQRCPRQSLKRSQFSGGSVTCCSSHWGSRGSR
jgi:hypothetical protein